MNKIYYFLFLSLLLGACTKEDALEPTGANDDYFTVPATATDPESVMRREFYEETGVHLLFNDTLRHEQRGTFEDGNPRWYTETVDLGYSMTSFDDAPALTYLQTKQEKEKAVEFVSKYILPHLGQAVRPYSFLMVNTIYGRDPDTYRKGILKYYIGMRTMALSMEPILKLETEEDYATLRYCTGFLQGAEAAAELQGEYVTLQTWFTDTYENNDAITQRMIDWYNNGTSLIMVSGGNLYEGVSDAVNQTGGKAITTDYDNTELGDRVLGSAIKCYNAAVQRQLYTFFAAGTWNGQTGGQTEKAGFTNGEVALEAGAPWRFDSFTQDDYRTLYEDLRTSVLKVDAYSDLDTLPETPNVTVDRLL